MVSNKSLKSLFYLKLIRTDRPLCESSSPFSCFMSSCFSSSILWWRSLRGFSGSVFFLTAPWYSSRWRFIRLPMQEKWIMDDEEVFNPQEVQYGLILFCKLNLCTMSSGPNAEGLQGCKVCNPTPQLGKLFQNHAVFHQKLSLHP